MQQYTVVCPRPHADVANCLAALASPPRAAQTSWSLSWLQQSQLLILCLQCGGKLQTSISGPAYDVFAKALRGLGAAKLTKPGNFKTADGHGLAVRCSYKVGDSNATGCPPLGLLCCL